MKRIFNDNLDGRLELNTNHDNNNYEEYSSIQTNSSTPAAVLSEVLQQSEAYKTVQNNYFHHSLIFHL